MSFACGRARVSAPRCAGRQRPIRAAGRHQRGLLTPAQWNAIIDVNVRGVVHGVAAAGQITSYVTTKHAVVGLSPALRSAATGTCSPPAGTDSAEPRVGRLH